MGGIVEILLAIGMILHFFVQFVAKYCLTNLLFLLIRIHLPGKRNSRSARLFVILAFKNEIPA